MNDYCFVPSQKTLLVDLEIVEHDLSKKALNFFSVLVV